MGKKLLALCLGMIFVLMLCYGGLSYEMSLYALNIWFEKLVPSMFCIMVLVKVMFSTGILHDIARPLGIVLGPLFHIDANSVTYVIVMMFLGFPAGAAFINEEVKHNRISTVSGKRLINTCSFATPGFVIMTCGSVLFHSVKIGFLLFMIQIISGLLLLFLTRKTWIQATNCKTEPISFMSAFTKSVIESGTTLYMIGGYLMLCMSIFSVLVQFMPSFMQLPIKILCEFSSGAVLLTNATFPLQVQLVYLSMLLSFGGLCVHMQVMSMCDACKLSYGTYGFYRILQALFSGLFTIVFLSYMI